VFLLLQYILSTGGDALTLCELRRPGNSQGKNWKVCNMTNFIVGTLITPWKRPRYKPLPGNGMASCLVDVFLGEQA
jgi:hypothetical protein